MIGLAYLVAAVVYALLLGALVRWAWRQGVAGGKKGRGWAYALLALFVGQLPLTYDYVPMLVMHKYYCEKDGGIIAYQDPARWMEAHAGGREALKVRAGGEPLEHSDPIWTGEYLINRKVARRFRQTSFVAPAGVEFVRSQYELVDVERKAVLVARVSYRAGKSFQSGNIRFWVYESDCKDGSANHFHDFERLLTVFSESQ